MIKSVDYIKADECAETEREKLAIQKHEKWMREEWPKLREEEDRKIYKEYLNNAEPPKLPPMSVASS